MGSVGTFVTPSRQQAIARMILAGRSSNLEALPYPIRRARTLPGDDQPDRQVTHPSNVMHGFEFRNLSGGLSRNDAFPFLTGPTPMRDIVLDGLGPLFVRADSERLLRDDRTHLDMAGWVQTVLGPLATRGDLTPETLRAYVLPALLRK